MDFNKKTNENVNLEFMKYPHYRVPNEIHEIGLKMAELAVYVVLCRYCNPGTTAYPSYSRIAEKAGCCRPTAIKAVERLIKIGLLKKTRRRADKDKMESNLYEVNHNIKGLYLMLAPDNDDINPDNDEINPDILEGGKAHLLPLVKEIYRGGKRDCLDKELPIKNYSYKELNIGSIENTLLHYNDFKKQYQVDNDMNYSIKYYLMQYQEFTGKEHMKLKLETWKNLIDTFYYVEIEHNKHIDIDSDSMIPMIDRYFSKEYNNGDCNRCITHFNNPGIKKVNFYEAAY